MFKGVLIDWGGVLTTNVAEAVKEWIEAERIDGSHYRTVMRELSSEVYKGVEGEENLFHMLERGEIDIPEFEREFASRLLTSDGAPPEAEGILARMFAAFRPAEDMYDALRVARTSGIKICLLSNSWGDHYQRDGWDDLFDEIVISGEIGMRKPEPRIFEHALSLVGLPAEQCVFVDDMEANIEAARDLGIAVIHHREPSATLRQLEVMLGIPLRR